MNKASRFFRLGLIIQALMLLVVVVLYLLGFIGGIDFFSIMVAAGISLINFLVGIIFFRIGIIRSNSVFLVSILGGILIRLFLTLLAVLMCLLFLELKPLSFIFSILFFYFLHLSIEIIYLNLRKN